MNIKYSFQKAINDSKEAEEAVEAVFCELKDCFNSLKEKLIG